MRPSATEVFATLPLFAFTARHGPLSDVENHAVRSGHKMSQRFVDARNPLTYGSICTAPSGPGSGSPANVRNFIGRMLAGFVDHDAPSQNCQPAPSCK